MNFRGFLRTQPNIHPLTIFAKYSILDVRLGFEYASEFAEDIS